MIEKFEGATRRIPKPVDRGTHAALDYLTTSFFLVTASMFWGRHKRAAFTALVNGFMVLGVSVFTDYPGSLRKLISFQKHGDMDILQASLAAGMPTLLGFGGSSAAKPFRLQALNEAFVLSITDFETGAESKSTSQAA